MSSKEKHLKRKQRSLSRSRSEERSRSRSASDSSTRRKHKKSHKKHKHRGDGSRDKIRHRREEEKNVELSKEEKKQQKEMIKALETPEEKRARRLAKKIAKGRKAKEKMGWDEEYMGYTNADNPFGDEHLLDTFVWHKKLEKEGKKEFETAEIEKIQKRQMMDNKMELEKVKQRRLQRERDRSEREDEQEMMQRQKEAEYFREWEKQEDKFHMQQAKLRSKIRIKDARAKPIDLLAQYINTEDDDIDVEMHEPYMFLYGLTIQDLEDLLVDIKVYHLELEEGKNSDFWRDITIIAEEELNKLRKIDPSNTEYVGDRRSGINQAVSEDIGNVFKGKTMVQLQSLEEKIRDKLKGGEGIDIGYWESLLQQLKAHMARQRLRERHQDELRRKLFKLKQEQGIESGPLFPSMMNNCERSSSAPKKHSDASNPQPGPSGLHRADDEHEDEESENNKHCQEYTEGSYSPKLMPMSDLPADAILLDAEDDVKRLEFGRQLVVKTGQAEQEDERELMRVATAGMNEEEARFSVQVPLRQEALVWSDKYRPRKPRFFNRVHTGFEWNKYNQTHYDIDNPPPKIVQGYKFNIFYPDLIDKSKTPTYVVTPMDDDKEFAVLRFHAGAPYEDIAFKIVNREWDTSERHGYRCQFGNNVLQLWFRFKRYRYRR